MADAAAEPMVAIRDVTKRFRQRAGTGGDGVMTALDRVSLAIAPGELVCLLGASGCGKTTLLRIVAGLVTADDGVVRVAGSNVRAPRRDLCMVFQTFGLLPWRTVLENVAFPLELDGMKRAEREEAAAHYIGLVGLAGFERHYPHELSGGMQQRVGIARALARKPSVLLMDEPFAALDAQTREHLQEDFLKVWQGLGTTVLFVTHSIDEALVMADRIVVLSARPGRVRRELATPFDGRVGEDVRAHPAFGRHRHEIRELLRGDSAP